MVYIVDLSKLSNLVLPSTTFHLRIESEVGVGEEATQVNYLTPYTTEPRCVALQSVGFNRNLMWLSRNSLFELYFELHALHKMTKNIKFA